MIDLGTYSRFKDTPTTHFDGEEVFGRWVKPLLLTKKLNTTQVSSLYVTNNFAGRPDKIAQALYGASELDWVIIAYNRPAAVLNWPAAGTVILVPASEVVLAEIL